MNVSQILPRLKKVFGNMVCGAKRPKDEPVESRPVPKKAKRISVSKAISRDVGASLQIRHGHLRRFQQSVEDALNQVQIDNLSPPNEENITAEKASALAKAAESSPDYPKENEKLKLMLQTCESELAEKDLVIVSLENNVVEGERVKVELEARVEIMQQQLCKELQGCGSYADGAATPFQLESTLKAVQTSASSFAKIFLDYTKQEGIEVIVPLQKQFHNAYLTRGGHVTYLLRAWIFETLFRDFENEAYTCGGSCMILDSTERRLHFFEYFKLLETGTDASGFHPQAKSWLEEFCLRNFQSFMSLWLPADQSTAWNVSTARLMEAFRSMATGAWTFHKLSLSFQTNVEIIRLSRQDEFNADYMDSVVSLQDDDRFLSKVGFMICPGFRLKKSVLKCQIYLAASDFIQPQEISL